ncbi:hypothetical protein CDAR_204461 [Caerostris darwini]|uniref:Uncharacterized protein n=1 Tax=Caerostris darwini TaxID=1538125 RepID=A0AAV4R1S1_9ARAC|nr:hypothetical protein CDAR_204461 [Caerostris darwini]
MKTARKVAAREVRAIKVRGPCLRWPRGMRRTPNGKCGQLSVTGPLMAGDTHWVGLQATLKNNRQVIARYSFSHSQHCFFIRHLGGQRIGWHLLLHCGRFQFLSTLWNGSVSKSNHNIVPVGDFSFKSHCFRHAIHIYGRKEREKNA